MKKAISTFNAFSLFSYSQNAKVDKEGNFVAVSKTTVSKIQ